MSKNFARINSFYAIFGAGTLFGTIIGFCIDEFLDSRRRQINYYAENHDLLRRHLYEQAINSAIPTMQQLDEIKNQA